MRWTYILCTLLACACGSSTPSFRSGSVRRDLSPDLSNFDPAELIVRVDQGSVLVTNGPALRCEVQLFVSAENTANAEAIADQLGIEPLLSGDRLRLALARPEGVDLARISLAMKLEVPARMSLDLRTQQAGVTLRDYRGKVVLGSRQGRIRADLEGCPHFEGVSDSGSVEIRGTFQKAHLRTGEGRLTAFLPLAVDRGASELELVSDSGTTVLFVHEQESLSLEFESRSGRYYSELPLSWTVAPERQTRTLIGRLGNPPGEPRVRVRTTSGELLVQSLGRRVRGESGT